MGIDYYGVLRLTRTCTDLDIKLAYRRLAIQFHPKRLKSKDATQTFELISEAYEVLVDPLKRAIFAQYGEEGLKSGVVTPDGYFEPYVYHGNPLQTLREFFGTDSPYADLLSVIYTPLPMYDLPEGRGIKTKGKPVIHPLQLTLEELYHGGIKKMKIQRLVFKDESETVTVLKEKILTIPIKPGLPSNTEFIFHEEGDQGPTKIPADVIFVTQDKPHPIYERVGDDLVMVVNINLLEALTGYTVLIKTLDDRTFRVPITDVIHPTYEKVVDGEGMPIVGTEDKGNLIIRFNIEYPQYFPLNCKTMLVKAFNCANISGGITSPELINKMVLHDKMNRIDKNGFVECLQGCPSIDGCFQLIEKPKNGCCMKCKGCVYNGTEYASDTEWTDPQDPCRVFRCEAGVITKSILECYTPCDNPLPPQPGQCCKTCLGCRINGQRVTDERDVTIPEDPCLKCHCELGRMTCTKRACPVLQCPVQHQYHPVGECCPQCKGTRTLLPSASGCILGRNYLSHGQHFKMDPQNCTTCKCIGNGTSVCQRSTCPVLLCAPEDQKTAPGACCPHCPPVEEIRTTCLHKGKLYQDGESWQLDPCKSCMCQDGEIHCAMEKCPHHNNVPCPPNHKLIHPSGQCCPKCVESDGVCTVFGDPHYKTFDGRFYSFQGSCKYQLVADCVDHSFSIRVTNDNRKTKVSSWTKTISIKIKDIKINLGQKKRIKVNGKRINIPYSSSNYRGPEDDGYEKRENREIRIDKSDEYILVSTYIGVQILWDGNSFLEVSVPTRYKGKLCGLCGNYNSIVRDDLVTRKGKQLNETEIWKFAQSWRVGGKKACARHNEHNSNEELAGYRGETIQHMRGGSHTCNNPRYAKWTQHFCLPLIRDNKFGNCAKKLNPAKYYTACIQDMCECPNGKCFCESFIAYARECKRLGVQLNDWRAQTNCYGNITLNNYHYNNFSMKPSNSLALAQYSQTASSSSFNSRDLMQRDKAVKDQRQINQNKQRFNNNKNKNKLQPPKRPKILRTRGPPPPLLNVSTKEKKNSNPYTFGN